MTDKVLSWNEKIVDEFRRNAGNVETNDFGTSLVLIHHVGAKSDLDRVNPLRELRVDDDTWIVVGSNQGAEIHPDWYFNLKARPNATLEAPGSGTVDVGAEILSHDARREAWGAFISAYPVFAQYQDATNREFPVVALRRR